MAFQQHPIKSRSADPTMDDPVKNPYISPADTAKSSTFGGETTLIGYVRTGQIITFSLIMGVVFMAGILMVIGKDGEPNSKPELFLWLGVGLGCLACVASFVLSRVLRAQALSSFRQQASDADLPAADDKLVTPAVHQLLSSAFTAQLVGQSVLEGVAVVNAILMLLDHNLLHLAVIAVMIVGIALHVPTTAKRQELIEEGCRM